MHVAMKTSITVLKSGLSALALWAGAGAMTAATQITSLIMTPLPSGDAAAPQLTIQSDLVVTNLIQYKATLSQKKKKKTRKKTRTGRR